MSSQNSVKEFLCWLFSELSFFIGDCEKIIYVFGMANFSQKQQTQFFLPFLQALYLFNRLSINNNMRWASWYSKVTWLIDMASVCMAGKILFFCFFTLGVWEQLNLRRKGLLLLTTKHLCNYSRSLCPIIICCRLKWTASLLAIEKGLILRVLDSLLSSCIHFARFYKAQRREHPYWLRICWLRSH